MQLRACSSLAVDETTTTNFLGEPHQTALLRHAVIKPRIHSSRMQAEDLDLGEPHFDATVVESHCKEDIEEFGYFVLVKHLVLFVLALDIFEEVFPSVVVSHRTHVDDPRLFRILYLIPQQIGEVEVAEVVYRQSHLDPILISLQLLSHD